MKLKDNYHPYAIITIIFWSLAFVLTRLALRYFSAFSLGFLRYLIASCALLAVALFTKINLPKVRDIPWFFAAGAFGFFIYMIAFNTGTETVTAATGSIIIATAPVFTALLARLFYREKLNAFQWVAIVVEFSGVVFLTMMNGSFTVNHGLIWLFLAAISLSIYNLLQRKLTKTYSGLQSSTYSIFAGTIMLAVFSPASIQEAHGAPPIQWLCVAILGIFSSAIAYVTWAQAFKKAKWASSVSNYMFVTPFLTSLLGFLLAKERPDMPTLLGGGMILVGMLLFNFEKNLRIILHVKMK
ncbi:MAG: DMT family transporter [Candidatus Pelethousia sp.]|nr:DMT family transporter [Candidatus Pelethousia sp.]